MSDDFVRTDIAKLFSDVVLGPQQPEETLASNPSDTYLTGILWPTGSTLSAADDDAGSAEVASDDAEGLDIPVPGYRSFRPCSIGLTCNVSADATLEIDLSTTSRYMPVAQPTEIEPKKSDAPVEVVRWAEAKDPPEGGSADERGSAEDVRIPASQAWKRSPLEYRLAIGPVESRSAWRTSEFSRPDGSPVTDRDLAIDVKRRVSGSNIVLTITLINVAPQPKQQQDVACLFQAGLRVRAVRTNGRPGILPRRAVQFADDEDALSNMLLYRDVREFAVGHGVAIEWPQDTSEAVEWVATSWNPRVAVRGMNPDGHRDFETLRRKTPNPFAAASLSREDRRDEVCRVLEELCTLYANWIERELENKSAEFSGDLRTAADANLKRCIDTLTRMRRGVRTLKTADGAWLAFALANAAMDRQSQYPSKGTRAQPLVWRPFQLAFLLLVIPSIVDPNDADRNTMDLLWFPTGGGKTEAYLALSAFTIFLARLRSPACRNDGGVEVLMRYTLRLLTIQQFQRAAALIAACDQIRNADIERLGTRRISIGLYVGGDSTPNKLADAEERLSEERNGGRPKSTPRQLLKCPVCGGALQTSAYRVDVARRTMDIVCSEPICEFSNSPLPVMTVDEAIYENPPSLVIGTVDKFAQLPRRTDIRSLFGLDGTERPGLIIQDELHLISGPLGSIAGLYEATIDLLCEKNGVRPKVIGSTATIGRAEKQVRALFDRAVLQFPPPGLNARDSFFAVRDDVGPDRLYLGISSAGRSPKFALQAVLAALLQTAFVLRASGKANDAAIDPYWTCVAYFNSLRELGGAHVLMLDDVPRQMQFLARRLGGSARVLEGPPEELSSRKPSNEIPEILLRIESQLGSNDPFAPEPPYAVLASNMISVGVDVPRLGLMAINGQPKSTAEYIQATSRVGRGLPGLLVTIYNFGRPRDVSHFEHFLAYHGALYRGVEATSVTPWAPRARDKALHAVLIAGVRHLVGGLVEDEDAINFDPASPDVSRIIDRLLARANAGTGGLETAATRADLAEIVNVWSRKRTRSRAEQKRLRYWEKRAPFGRTAPHLMRAAEAARAAGSDSWPTPNSMREVEPSTAFVLKNPLSGGKPTHGDE